MLAVLVATPALADPCETADQLWALREVRGALPRAIAALIAELPGTSPIVCDEHAYVVVDAEAERVVVASDANRWNADGERAWRFPNGTLHLARLELPRDARIDYKLVVDGTWMLDPLNPKTVLGGFGPNSELTMPEHQQDWSWVAVDVTAVGATEQLAFDSAILGHQRRVDVYLPAGYDSTSSYPTLYVLDGSEYLSLASLSNVLDNVIRQGRMDPAIAVCLAPGDRNREYRFDDRYRRHLVEEIVPWVEARFAARTTADERAILGASLGGLTALQMVLDEPEVFGVALSQSGAFGADGMRIQRHLPDVGAVPGRFRLQCGTIHDGLEANQALVAHMRERGADVTLVEVPEGHSWGNWRGHLAPLLESAWPH